MLMALLNILDHVKQPNSLWDLTQTNYYARISCDSTNSVSKLCKVGTCGYWRWEALSYDRECFAVCLYQSIIKVWTCSLLFKISQLHLPFQIHEYEGEVGWFLFCIKYVIVLILGIFVVLSIHNACFNVPLENTSMDRSSMSS